MRIIDMKTEEQVNGTIDKVLTELSCTMKEKLDIKQRKILAYWLNDWNEKFLTEEKNFEPNSLIKYKRGNIVKVHLGYNIGSEQGGLHYGLVLDNENSKSSGIVTIIPLRSLEKNESEKDIDERFEVFLGNGVLVDKIEYVKKQIKEISDKLEVLEEGSCILYIKYEPKNH